jgi:hypothetical protein
MTRWKYLVLSVIDGEIHSQNGDLISPEWTSFELWQYLDQLGAEGWELVGISERGDAQCFYFKRAEATS